MAQKRNRRRKKPILTPNQPLVKYGVITFNSIGYGNPTINQKLTMEIGGKLDDTLEEFKKKPFPENESDETLSELKYIKTKIRRLDNRKTFEECVAIDTDLPRYLEEVCAVVGINGVKELVRKVERDFLDSFVFKLKYHYNRARPHQLSFYYINQEELNPLKSCQAMSPSYPSGHTLESYVIIDILEKHFPQHKELFDTVKRRVAISRIIIGVHYPSDNDFSTEIAETIKQNPYVVENYYTPQWEEAIKQEIKQEIKNENAPEPPTE